MDFQIQDKDFFELNVEEQLRPSVERKLTGTTKMDLEIESNPIPSNPIFIALVIHLIRFYQRFLSSKLGNRCVFEPSCSHYCEVVIREFGLIRGTKLTLYRLMRCKSGNGGIDLPL